MPGFLLGKTPRGAAGGHERGGTPQRHFLRSLSSISGESRSSALRTARSQALGSQAAPVRRREHRGRIPVSRPQLSRRDHYLPAPPRRSGGQGLGQGGRGDRPWGELAALLGRKRTLDTGSAGQEKRSPEVPLYPGPLSRVPGERMKQSPDQNAGWSLSPRVAEPLSGKSRSRVPKVSPTYRSAQPSMRRDNAGGRLLPARSVASRRAGRRAAST